MACCVLSHSIDENLVHIGYAFFDEDLALAQCGVIEDSNSDEFHSLVADERIAFFVFDGIEFAKAIESSAAKADKMVPDFLCYDIGCIIFTVVGSGKGWNLRKIYHGFFGKSLPEEMDALEKAKITLMVLKEATDYSRIQLASLFSDRFKSCSFYMHGCLNAIISKTQFEKNVGDVYANLDSMCIERLVFFDLECANCFDGIGKICEFGAVTTDLEFNIIHRDFFLINPEDRFALRGRGGSPDLRLAYPEKAYFSAPKLALKEKEIRSVLANEGTLIGGFAVRNDVSFLATDLNSYDLPQIDYPCFDVQEWVSPPDHSLSLEKAYAEIVPTDMKRPFQEHRSVDDAEMTMEVAKYFLASQGKSLLEILKLRPESVSTSKGFIDLWLAEPDLPYGKRPAHPGHFPYPDNQ